MKVEDLVIVSVDDHIVEPPTMWDAHLTQAQKAFAPVLRKDKKGVDYWLFEGRRAGSIGLNAVVGRMREEYGCEPVSFDQMRKGAWDIHARIEDMNANGILASLNFPSVVQFDGTLFHQFENMKHALVLLKAYNDWHIDEWCGAYPGRNIPNALIPYWDVQESVAEIKRVVAKGCHAISFSDNPSLRGQPSIHDPHWDPLWKVCSDNEVAINIHIGSGASAPHASMASPIDAWITTMPISIVNSAADWLHLKALQAYSNLKISLSEGGIGWIPYFLERADFTHAHHSAWTHADFKGKTPSEVFREHFITCFIDDRFGLANLDAIGEDNVCYECDYPHSDTVWAQNRPDYLLRSVQHLSATAVDKITHLNALKLFHFDAFGKMGGRHNCTAGALRAQAAHVDISPKSYGGPAPLPPGETARQGHLRLTSRACSPTSPWRRPPKARRAAPAARRSPSPGPLRKHSGSRSEAAALTARRTVGIGRVEMRDVQNDRPACTIRNRAHPPSRGAGRRARSGFYVHAETRRLPVFDHRAAPPGQPAGLLEPGVVLGRRLDPDPRGGHAVHPLPPRPLHQ